MKNKIIENLKKKLIEKSVVSIETKTKFENNIDLIEFEIKKTKKMKKTIKIIVLSNLNKFNEKNKPRIDE